MTRTGIDAIQKQMQDCLCQLGINLVVVWEPDNSKSVHGEIKGNVIFLYDSENAKPGARLRMKSLNISYRLLHDPIES